MKSSHLNSNLDGSPKSGLTGRSFIKKIVQAFNTFDLRQQGLMVGFIIIGSVLLLSWLWTIGQNYTVTTATSGGSLTEGVIGSPRFINPLLAISDTDQDLSALVYSGLLRIGPDGKLVPDLAESYDISEDGLTYTFQLKEGLSFHDGKKLTARDVVFTVIKAQDAAIRSTKRASWDGVTVEQSGDRTVVFKLPQPYAPFIENMTLGILPTHLWSDIDSESFSFSNLNTNPVGSGPYQITEIKRDNSGIPIYYDLVPFNNFALGEAKISNIRMKFYPNEKTLIEDLGQGGIDSAGGINPNKITEIDRKDINIITAPLPRTFGVFFNQNQANLFTQSEVRQALNLATQREKIIDEVLAGYGQAIDSPLPDLDNHQIINPDDTPNSDTSTSTPESLVQAQQLLADHGWQADDSGVLTKKSGNETFRLEFTLTTADTAELKKVAEIIKSDWESIGAKVELKIFESGNLNQTIIRPRKYDALLFGTVIGRHPDPYAFWHSSQRLDPGLNIALYANITADKLLEKLHVAFDESNRQDQIDSLKADIKKDVPAIFIYVPQLIYITPQEIKNVSFTQIADASDRFNNIHNWYIKTENIWKNFVADRQVISN